MTSPRFCLQFADGSNHHGLDGVHPVFGLVENLGMLAAEDLVGNLHRVKAKLLMNFPANDGVEVVEGGQAVEENHVGILGLADHLHVDLVGLEEPDPLGELALLAHGNPHVGIDNISVADTLIDILGEFDGGPRLGGQFPHLTNELVGGEKLFGSHGHEVHAQLGTADHEGVAHVVPSIADVDKLHFPEGLVHVLLDGHHVGQNLGGMVEVRQSVPDGDTGMLSQKLHRLLLEASELDAIVKAAQNLGRILNRLLLAHLAVAEEGNLGSLVETGHFEGAAGPGGRLLEKENDILALKQVSPDTAPLLGFQIHGKIQKIVDFQRTEILKGNELTTFQRNWHTNRPPDLVFTVIPVYGVCTLLTL